MSSKWKLHLTLISDSVSTNVKDDLFFVEKYKILDLTRVVGLVKEAGNCC
jgi:hypothetical protein